MPGYRGELNFIFLLVQLLIVCLLDHSPAGFYRFILGTLRCLTDFAVGKLANFPGGAQAIFQASQAVTDLPFEA
jgi:hypothetical protein